MSASSILQQSVGNNSQQRPRNILAEHKGIKIDEKFIFKLIKDIKNVKKEVKDNCKVLHFSAEWNFEEILTTIDKLDPKDYPQAFIFVIEATNIVFSADNQEESSKQVARLQKKLLKVVCNRPIILQLTSLDENVTKLYYKEETSSQFTTINQHHDDSEESNAFLSFLRSFFDGNFNGSEEKILDFLINFENRSLTLRFLKALNLSSGFFGSLILGTTTKCTKAEFLAALDSPFDSEGRILSLTAQRYIYEVFGNNNDPKNKSVLLKAVKNENTEVIVYLITYWTHLIQELPLNHQIRISTAAFKKNQLDVLCDLLDIADYPFPKDFKVESVNHDKLKEIIAKRDDFKVAIETENFIKINDFINTNPNLKFIFNPSNNSALTEALNLKKFSVFYYLKSLGFKGEICDDILKNLSQEEEEKAVKLAKKQRKQNVNKSESIAPKSVMLLSMRSSVHNSRTVKTKQTEYRGKIMKWFMDIYKVAPEMIDVAASCDYLKIIFDFESDSVENMSLTDANSDGTMHPSKKWIFVGAKLSDRIGNVTKQREQQIKGVLAHELCHYVMRLVYENQENPYFNHREDLKEMFENIVKTIDKWSVKNSQNPDDECNGIISTVFTLYDAKNFHPELIVRAVHILTEFDDNDQHSRHLQEKYKILYDFWQDHVIPELQNYLLRNKQIVKLNGFAELLNNILKEQIEVKPAKDINKLLESKLAIATTNHPKLLLIDICKNLKEKFGDLMDSKNFFAKPEKLCNWQIWNEFNQICSENNELSIFVDCTEGVPESLGNIFINKELNFIFVVSNEQQCEELVKICERKDVRNAQKLEINYNWSDLTEKSQDSLLESKINFQNNSQILLKDLLKDDNARLAGATDLSQIIDDQLLKYLVKNQEISINSKHQEDQNEKHFNLVFRKRKFLENQKLDENEDEKLPIISQEKLLTKVGNKQYALISDIAGNGKSWAMKNFTKILREKNPTNWVSYVDLKQFIEEFKKQKVQPEFSSFMAEEIFKLEQKFEEKIFQKMYKNGKVFILFDGFDEIAPNYAEFVSKLAQNFQSNGGNQLWIATRDYFEVDLMEKLKLDVAYSLEKMSEWNGIKLIAKSWVIKDLEKDKSEPKSKKDFNESIKNSLEYETYLQKAHKITKKTLISRNNSIGLPQIFKMIADGFKDEENVDDLKGPKIYVILIKILYKRWSQEKGQIRNEANTNSQDFDLNFNKFHQFHAILSLFPELAEILFPGYDGKEWRQEEIIAGGILTIMDGEVYFIHETFREYFVADFIAKALEKSEINEKVVEVFVEILTIDQFQVIRMFLNDMIDGSSVLTKIKPQMEKYFEKFYKMTSFYDFFTNNLQNLVDFVLEVLKIGDYEQVKEVLNRNVEDIAENTTDSKMFQKFLEFIFNFSKVDDLKELIIKGEVFLEIIKSSLKIESFEDFVTKTKEKTDQEFVGHALMKKSKNNPYGNIFYFLSQSSNLNSDKVQKFLKIVGEFVEAEEIFESIYYCNCKEVNILLACNEEKNFKILFTEIEHYFDAQKFPERLKIIVMQSHWSNGNILHYVAGWTNIEVHETLWKFLFKIIEDREELKSFILHKTRNGKIFVDELVSENKNPAIVELTFKILKEKFIDATFQEILTSKGKDQRNLLQSAANRSNVIEVHQFLWKIFRDFCGNGEKFLEMLKEVDEDKRNILHIAAGSMKSSSEIFEFIMQELEKIASRDEIREMLRNLDNKNRYLLQTAAWLHISLELHSTLWKTMRKYFDDSEILEFIKNVDEDGNNLLCNTVFEGHTPKEFVELTWNEIKSFLTHDEHVEYLKLKGKDGKNLLECAFRRRFQNKKVHKWRESLFQEYGIELDVQNNDV